MARPMPVPAPVMRATLFSRRDTSINVSGRAKSSFQIYGDAPLSNRGLGALLDMTRRHIARICCSALGLKPNLAAEHPIYENEISQGENHCQRPPDQPDTQAMMAGCRV